MTRDDTLTRTHIHTLTRTDIHTLTRTHIHTLTRTRTHTHTHTFQPHFCVSDKPVITAALSTATLTKDNSHYITCNLLLTFTPC